MHHALECITEMILKNFKGFIGKVERRGRECMDLVGRVQALLALPHLLLAQHPALPPPQPTDIKPLPGMPGFSCRETRGSAERRHNRKRGRSIKTGRGKGHTPGAAAARWFDVGKVGKAGRTKPRLANQVTFHLHMPPLASPLLSCNRPPRNAERRLPASKKHFFLFKSAGSKPPGF